MKKTILICLSILHISNLSAQNNKGETAAAVVAGVATVVGAIAVNKDRIKKLEHNIQPSPHWFYNGKSVKELYDETYSFED